MGDARVVVGVNVYVDVDDVCWTLTTVVVWIGSCLGINKNTRRARISKVVTVDASTYQGSS
jgi:hypothetical protein